MGSERAYKTIKQDVVGDENLAGNLGIVKKVNHLNLWTTLIGAVAHTTSLQIIKSIYNVKSILRLFLSDQLMKYKPLVNHELLLFSHLCLSYFLCSVVEETIEFFPSN